MYVLKCVSMYERMPAYISKVQAVHLFIFYIDYLICIILQIAAAYLIALSIIYPGELNSINC